MNTKRLTVIAENGTERTYRAPLGGRITATVEQGMPCISVTNVLGTQVDTICRGGPGTPALPRPSDESSGSSGGCGCSR